MSSAEGRKKCSPLKRKPLRNPGESLQQDMERLLEDKVMPDLWAAAVVVMLAAWEWWRWFTKSPPRPVPVTLAAILVIAYGVRRFFRFRKQYKSLRLGLEGEKVVGQSLESLRSCGCRVFHDVPGDGFNVDHVVVGPQGVFAIETKTFSKPARGESKVTYDGEKVLVNGREPDRNPVIQARASRDWVIEILQEATSRRFPVKGAVVLPGWWVVPCSNKKRPDIWVLNPKALPAFIEREPIVLKNEDIALACSALEYRITRE